MTTRLSLKAVGNTTSLFLVIVFSLCVIFDLVFPEYAMYEVWQKLLPGFTWINKTTLLIGLLEVYVYGWFFSLIWVPLYNAFSASPQKY